MSAELTKALVDRFLAWKLPASVCSDTCVTDRNYGFPRSGTNLLDADEARQMVEHLFAGGLGDFIEECEAEIDDCLPTKLGEKLTAIISPPSKS